MHLMSGIPLARTLLALVFAAVDDSFPSRARRFNPTSNASKCIYSSTPSLAHAYIL